MMDFMLFMMNVYFLNNKKATNIKQRKKKHIWTDQNMKINVCS